MNTRTVQSLTPEQLKDYERAVWDVWGQIAGDVLEGYEVMGQEMCNEELIESCLDANRLWLNGDYKELDDLLYQLDDAARKQLRSHLLKHVSLC